MAQSASSVPGTRLTTSEDRVPTYQYSCIECGDLLERFQSFSDDSLTECPTCRGRLRKVFNAVGVVFKGSGFYRNDSRPKPGKTETDSGSSSNGSTEKSSSGSDSSSKTAKTAKTSATGTPAAAT